MNKESMQKRTYVLKSLIAAVVMSPVFVFGAEGVDVSFAVQSLQIHDVIKSQLSPKASWSLVAVDLETGKGLVDAKETRNDFLLPGSLIKLFVTAALLDKNASDPFNLDTVVAVKGKVEEAKLVGSVILKGSGNALLSGKDLLPVIEKIKSLGIGEITGNIIVDAFLFDLKGWKSSYTGAGYGVPSALGLDLHTVSITVEADKREAMIDPPNDAVKVKYTTTGKPEIRQRNDYVYEVFGSGPGHPAVHKRFSLANPSEYAGGTFRTLLKRAGVAVSGRVRTGVMSDDAREIARIGAPSINAFVKDTNRESLNVTADNMLFLLGSVTFGAPGTREKGIRAVKKFLDELGVPVTGMIIDDGSGLSGKNKASADQISTFLQSVSKKPWFPVFYESLSRPGMDGRLRDFAYKSEHIRAKAGQLPDAFGIAGYIDRADGRKIAFSYLINGSGLDMMRAGFTSTEVLRHLEEK